MMVYLIKLNYLSSYYGRACDPHTYRSSVLCFPCRESANMCRKRMISYKNANGIYPHFDNLDVVDIDESKGYGDLQVCRAKFDMVQYHFTAHNISLLMCASDDALIYTEYPIEILDHSFYANILDTQIDNIDIK